MALSPVLEQCLYPAVQRTAGPRKRDGQIRAFAAQVGAMFFYDWTFRFPAYCLDSIVQIHVPLNQAIRRVKGNLVSQTLTGRGRGNLGGQVKWAKILRPLEGKLWGSTSLASSSGENSLETCSMPHWMLNPVCPSVTPQNQDGCATFSITRCKLFPQYSSLSALVPQNGVYLGSQKVHGWNVELPLTGSMLCLLWGTGSCPFCLLCHLTQWNLFFS